ncbi:helix-turn-helix domain-containing protein [Desulfotomaculum sp. 1211_IL3151]|uniref:helix-turn-helix domain-containing protein n=1 Tax=Desulfotomaculum sp. 1211_IL3151 TaxID=3084055 RepID=UPI002FD98180
MDKNKIYLLGAVILSISIFASSIIISTSFNHLSASIKSFEHILLNQKEEKNVMTLDEAADYLHISTETLKYMSNEISGLQIPYLKVDDQYIFTKQGLDKWLESNHWDLDY